ncbi:hypothetical protein KPL71_013484 [Citrus sinensis]|uniref:Uncharacterized protein n=1 Tax=Citrus sinensis TaxID=2711 RepID=A0ACB8LKC8_CITSI|nr:hypothetical protein KPL71_013484 [Citrus sinensis]
MSGTITNAEKEQEQEIAGGKQVDAESCMQDQEPNDSEKNIDENLMQPSSQQEEEIIKKKYGGIVPKKRPLISKDHERAFFDSADWALGKQGGQSQKPKGPLEPLRPKLQPTPHQQVRSRRSAYAPSDDEEDGGSNITTSDDQGFAPDCANNNTSSPASEDQSSRE